MKIRIGFISNSSSSSYIAMTIGKWNHPKTIAKIMKALDLPDNAGYDELNDAGFNEVDHDLWEKHGLNIYECDGVSMIGMEIEADLRNDRTLSEIKEHLQKLFKKIGVDVSTSEMELSYGEWGSG